MSRISRYLARIRTFRFENLDHKEFGVCSSLSMLDPVGWLFPNLRELYINFGEMAILKPHYFTPLLTPSLRSITILGPLVNGYNEEASYAILNKLKLCNAKISDISYTGYTSSRIIKRIMDFSSLCSIAVVYCPRQEKEACNVHIASFLTRNLTNLDINVNHFPDNILQETGKQFEHLESLTSLTLRGALNTIHQCIHGLNPIASISSFGLYRHALSEEQISVPSLTNTILTIFPNLHSLHLQNNPFITSMMTLNDLMSFRERPLRALDLIKCFKSTEPTNIIEEILRVWPTLQHLRFEDGNLSAEHILPLISCSAPSLQDLTLSLKFPDVWNKSIPNKVICPLQHLKIPLPWEKFPKAFQCARRLLELFPALKTISEETGLSGRFATVDIDVHDLVIDDENRVNDRIIQARSLSAVPIRSMRRECDGIRMRQALGLI